MGFSPAAYPVGVWRGWMTRRDAIERTWWVLRFFWTRSNRDKDVYYHFLDMTSTGPGGVLSLVQRLKQRETGELGEGLEPLRDRLERLP